MAVVFLCRSQVACHFGSVACHAGSTALYVDRLNYAVVCIHEKTPQTPRLLLLFALWSIVECAWPAFLVWDRLIIRSAKQRIRRQRVGSRLITGLFSLCGSVLPMLSLTDAVDGRAWWECACGVAHTAVLDAVERIVHLEECWNRQELVDRIMRHFKRGVKMPELRNLDWQGAIKAFIAKVMTGVHTAFHDKRWLFELDLTPAVLVSAQEIAKVKCPEGVDRRELEEVVDREYEAKPEKWLRVKALWIVVEATFKNQHQAKLVYSALDVAYDVALRDCLDTRRPLRDCLEITKDRESVETFARKWIQHSMRGLWSHVWQSDRAIAEQQVLGLFRNLLVPFGDDSVYSCVPSCFTRQLGRPPRKWEFLQNCVSELVEVYFPGAGTTPFSKRRRGGTAAETTRVSDDGCHRAEAGIGCANSAGHDLQPEQLPMILAAPGHPGCTSQEDCVGDMNDRLVTYIVDGYLRDTYCERCWRSFLDMDPSLRGLCEDTGQLYI